MKELFYLIAVYYLMNNIFYLLNFEEYFNRLKIFKNAVSGGKKQILYGDMSKEMKRYYVSILVNFCFLIWMFIGLLTFNWLLFLTIIIYMFLIYSPLYRMVYGTSILKPLVIVNKSIHIVWALFLIINAFHLKINLWEVILNLF